MEFRKELNRPRTSAARATAIPFVRSPKKQMSGRRLDHGMLRHKIVNADEVIAGYLHLREPCDRGAATGAHEHEDHREKALAFRECEGLRAANNALEVARAQLLRREGPEEFLGRRCRALGDRLLAEEDCEVFGLADFYARHHFPNFRVLTDMILSSCLHGTPGRRWTVLRGDYGAGKSTFAITFHQLFQGIAVQVNLPRLQFQLGEAAWRRFVLFDHVAEIGFRQMKGLKDHLEGRAPVLLKRKRRPTVSQIFPPGIIICNFEELPPEVEQRVQGPVTVRRSPLWGRHPLDVSAETLFIGAVLHDLLPAPAALQSHIRSKTREWWAAHDARGCDCLSAAPALA